MKKSVLLLSLMSIMLLICIPLIGCDSEESLAAEDIAQIAEGVSITEVDTVTWDMDMSADVGISDGGQSFPVSIDGRSRGRIDNINQELCMPLTLDVDATNVPFMGDQSESVSVAIYIVDGCMYMKSDGGWIKMELPQDRWEGEVESLPVGELTDMLAFAEIEYQGSETVNDVDCYKFQVTPDMVKLAEYVFEQFQEEGTDTVDFDLSDLEAVGEILSSFDVDCTYWIAKDSNLLMQIDLDMSGELSSEDIEGIGADADFGSDMNITIDLSMNMKFDYNQPVNIELPNEALGLWGTESYGTGWEFFF